MLVGDHISFLKEAQDHSTAGCLSLQRISKACAYSHTLYCFTGAKRNVVSFKLWPNTKALKHMISDRTMMVG